MRATSCLPAAHRHRALRAVTAQPPGRLTWLTLAAACTAVEAYGVGRRVQDGTFSEFHRWAMRTQTPAGRVAFRLGWVAFATWYLLHITPPQPRPRTAPPVTGPGPGTPAAP